VSHDPDRRARFEAVAAVVFEPMQRYLRRRASAADAADAFSESLAVIWRRLDDVPADDPLPWSYGVARRCLANQRRSGDRQLRLVDRVAAEPRQSGDGDPQRLIDGRDPELVAALDTLSANEAEIVRLWAWEQLEPREIADVLDLTPNAVSVALTRAKRKLRERLAGRQDPTSSGHRWSEDATDTGRSER
jgi:RNA polymerase sigma-70 factor (ECF subfamily)